MESDSSATTTRSKSSDSISMTSEAPLEMEVNNHHDHDHPKVAIAKVEMSVAEAQAHSALPLALLAFGTTTFLLSFVNAQIITDVPNVVLAVAFAYGGLCQLITCLWDIHAANALGAAVTGSYGAFWVAFSIILWPGSGIVNAYGFDFDNALGLFLMGFTFVTLLLLIASQKTSVAFILLMFLLLVCFVLLTLGSVIPNVSLTKAGGYVGIVVGLVAWYNALASLLTKKNSFFTLPVFPIK